MKYIRQLPTNVKSSDILRVSSELYGQKKTTFKAPLYSFLFMSFIRELAGRVFQICRWNF